MNRKLPIGEIFTAALKLPLQHTRKLILLGFPALLMLMLFDYIIPESMDFSVGKTELFIQLTVGLLTCLSIVIAVVGCHRTFLMKNNEKPLFWSGNEFSYFIWWIAMSLYIILILIPFALLLIPLTAYLEPFETEWIAIVGMLLLNIPMYYLISRWSLLLPAVATDKRGVDISWSWRLSKGNSWRLTLLIGLFPFTKEMIFAFIPVTESLLLSLVDNLMWLVIGIVEVGLLSLSYEFLVNNQAQDPEVNDTEMPEPEQA
ncbi:MAG: hypothetical protein ACPGR2_12725 [Psychrobium sp.]